MVAHTMLLVACEQSYVFARQLHYRGKFSHSVIDGTRIADRCGIKQVVVADVRFFAHAPPFRVTQVFNIQLSASRTSQPEVGSLKWLPMTSAFVPPNRSTNAWRVWAPCGLSISKFPCRMG